MKITAPSIKMPPEGWHRAVLSSYEDLGLTPDKYKPGKNRHVVKLVFKLDDDSEQFVWARASLHRDATLHDIMEALLGGAPGAEVELNDVVNRACDLHIVHHNSNGITRSKVDQYRAVNGQ